MCAQPEGNGGAPGKTLGVLLLSHQDDTQLEIVCGLLKAARLKGIKVEIFLMGDGVYYLQDPRLGRAIQHGATVRFCALNAIQRGLDSQSEYPWGAEEGSQYDLACIVEGSDRVLAFT
ncbi:MAG: DsrE family protein [Thermodesulfobacteriota bacterium]